MDFAQRVERRPRQLVLFQHAIAEEANAIRADCLRAEHASLLARHGFQREASEAIDELRRRYEARPHPSVTTWINLADGIVAHRGPTYGDATRKLRRAHALAAACANAPMQALAAAWLSHLLWDAHEVEAAVGYAREALRLAQPDDHRTRVRASLVVADMLALGLREESAEAWFATARRHAVAACDDASKSALSFNLGIVEGMLLRQAVLSRNRPADARLAELHRSVSENVDAALGIPADEWTRLQQAFLLSLLDRPQEALEIYGRHGRPIPSDGDRERAGWWADEAWCWLRVGRVDRALDAAASAERALPDATQLDDAASAHSLLAKVYAAAGDPSRAAAHAAEAEADWKEFAAYQAYCGSLAASITEAG